MARLKVLFFASCREAAGRREVDLELDDPLTVAGLLDALCRDHPSLAPLSGSLQVAVNAEYAPRDARLRDGDEIAPDSPGQRRGRRHLPHRHRGDRPRRPSGLREDPGRRRGRHLFGHGPGPHRRQGDLLPGVRSLPGDGRAGHGPPGRGGEGALARGRIGILHRVGRLEIGEISILVSVAAGHRREAFEACHHLVDRLKEVVPIWKKEVGPGGEYWVEGPAAGADDPQLRMDPSRPDGRLRTLGRADRG